MGSLPRGTHRGWSALLYFLPGVYCVGMGSKLFPKDVVAAKNWKAISDKCAEALGYIAKARG